ncbi:MAG: serine/threonine protein phosphatase [Hyphomicrobiales bacterium]|nr:serine/threonine protein phosphatase [Hyphomicrobiales bacterium]
MMARDRLVAQQRPAAIYAIGDIHGCLAELRAMERLIVDDANSIAGDKWLVTLGDYIDRGPQSAAVLDHLLAPPPPGFQRYSLLGNHEQLLLDFLSEPKANLNWLRYGGMETLQSYGIDPGSSRLDDPSPRNLAKRLTERLPPEHLQLLQDLPICLSVPGFIFVHAGIRPGIDLQFQDDGDLIWIRDEFLNAKIGGGSVVVHGHTPAPEAVITPYRIGIDTGCFATGRLSAVRITANGEAKLFTASAR